ncbi:MAG TPA: class I SAM-dependent methyltransferase [Steroidobacteraceae bacterium]|nr:class I SAM-dependent methyltransferase [Steroidobacteraceae bacterium]
MSLEVYHKARWAYRLGRRRKALELCRSVSFDKTDFLAAKILLSGPHYTEVLRRAHEAIQPAVYIEIGIDEGSTLRLAHPGTQVIGIDPCPKLTAPAGANTKIFRMTSDEYFATNSSPLAQMAFIDGMHQFEYALRDFQNLEHTMHPRGTLFVHDVVPLDERTATRERKTAFWSGDVWRFLLILRDHRPDLRVEVLNCPPTGLARITNLNPHYTWPAIDVDRYLKTGFDERIR